MARQYIPFSFKIANTNLIVYPVLDESPIKEVFKDEKDITLHLESLYKKNSHLHKGQYHIVFVWNLEGKRMTDVWVHLLNDFSDSGPILECYTFRELEPCQDAGIASGDSIIAIGREEEYRRSCINLSEYLNRHKGMPIFPINLKPDTKFS
jgi:hypothetical protein